MIPLAHLTVAIIGGDDRDLVLARELVSQGARVQVIGFPPSAELIGASLHDDLLDAVKGADVVLLPMPGTDANLVVRAIYSTKPIVLTEQWFASLGPKVPVFTGLARPVLREMAQNAGVHLVEIADRDEVAILNSIPSAEGAIQIAMEETDITIHGSRTVVVGFGRVGQTLVRMLLGLGARVQVVERTPSLLARAQEMGCPAHPPDSLGTIVGDAEIIFNTAPAIVLTKAILETLRRNTVIVDLASQPGGTDFPAAKGLGVKAILAPGLPGKVAPKSAGQILAKVYPRLFWEALQEVRSECVLKA